jgi:hypothetical protein
MIPIGVSGGNGSGYPKPRAIYEKGLLIYNKNKRGLVVVRAETTTLSFLNERFLWTKLFQTYLWERRTQGRPNFQGLYQRVCSEECSHRHHPFLDRIYNRRHYIYIFPSLSPISLMVYFLIYYHPVNLTWIFNYFKISSS